MKILFVTKVYEVRLPDDRTDINADIDDMQDPEDAAIVKASDQAVALHMTYRLDAAGRFKDLVGLKV